MTPTHVKKGNIRYHYYQSWVLAHGQMHKAGSVHRVSAGEIEDLITHAIAKHHAEGKPGGVSLADLRNTIERITVHPTRIEIELHPRSDMLMQGDDEQEISRITIPWSKVSATRKKQILGDDDSQEAKPIRSKARTRLLKGIAQGRFWLDQLLEGKVQDMAALAAKHAVSEKTVRSTLNLAFLSPDIIQATIDGRLPRGLGISQMTDLPTDWAEQRKQLGVS